MKIWGLYNPSILCFLAATALILSVVSTLDCSFLAVIMPPSSPAIGPFSPLWKAQQEQLQKEALGETNVLKYNEEDGDSNAMEAEHSITLINIGLWSFESPYDTEQCLTYQSAKIFEGGPTGSDTYYTRTMINGDIYFSVARVAAIVAASIGIIITFSMIFDATFREYVPTLVHAEVILDLFVFQLFCEGLKFGFFFNTGLCSGRVWTGSPPVTPAGWTPDGSNYGSSVGGPSRFLRKLEEENGSNFDPYDSNVLLPTSAGLCQFSRGAYASIVSMVALFVAMLLMLMYILHPRGKAARHEMEEEEARMLAADHHQAAQHAHLNSSANVGCLDNPPIPPPNAPMLPPSHRHLPMSRQGSRSSRSTNHSMTSGRSMQSSRNKNSQKSYEHSMPSRKPSLRCAEVPSRYSSQRGPRPDSNAQQFHITPSYSSQRTGLRAPMDGATANQTAQFQQQNQQNQMQTKNREGDMSTIAREMAENPVHIELATILQRKIANEEEQDGTTDGPKFAFIQWKCDECHILNPAGVAAICFSCGADRTAPDAPDPSGIVSTIT